MKKKLIDYEQTDKKEMSRRKAKRKKIGHSEQLKMTDMKMKL